MPPSAVFDQALIAGITAGGPGLVAVGGTWEGPEEASGRGAVWTSRDGRRWQAVKDFRPRTGLGGVASGPGGLVAFGTPNWYGEAPPPSELWASPDGRRWRAISLPQPAPSVEGIVAGASGYLAWGYPDGLISGDGHAWHAVQLPILSGVVATDSGYLGVGPRLDGVGASDDPSSTLHSIWASADGVTWQEAYVPVAELHEPMTIVRLGAGALVVGQARGRPPSCGHSTGSTGRNGRGDGWGRVLGEPSTRARSDAGVSRLTRRR